MDQMLTPGEFDTHAVAGTLRLAFVGMSNAGKSYRSRVLQTQEDFVWYCVDEDIRKALGFEIEDEISAWMGYPGSEGYKEREQKYLALEEEATSHAAMRTGGKNLVFDTTGSVVHLSPQTKQTLRDNCLVVHLEVGEEAIGKMMEKFFEQPKPVAWCGFFDIQTGESQEDALRRCYPALLKERLGRYKELAHVTVPAAEVRDKSGKETLEIIKKHLG